MKLPPELYIEIVEHLHDDKQTLKALSLVNRLFRDAAQAMLFEHFVLSNGLERVKEKVEGLLEDGGRLIKYVRCIEVRASAVVPAGEFRKMRGISDSDNSDGEEGGSDDEKGGPDDGDEQDMGDNMAVREGGEGKDDMGGSEGRNSDECSKYPTHEFLNDFLALISAVKDTGNKLKIMVGAGDETIGFDDEGFQGKQTFDFTLDGYSTVCVEFVAFCLGMVDLSDVLDSISLHNLPTRDLRWITGNPAHFELSKWSWAPNYEPTVFKHNMDMLKKFAVFQGNSWKNIFERSGDNYCDYICNQVLENTGVANLVLGISTKLYASTLNALSGSTNLISLSLVDMYLKNDFGRILQSCTALRELTMDTTRLRWHPHKTPKGIPWKPIFMSLSKIPLTKLRIHQLNSDYSNEEYCFNDLYHLPVLVTERKKDIVALRVLVEAVLGRGGQVQATYGSNWATPGDHKVFREVRKFEDILICRHKNEVNDEDGYSICDMSDHRSIYLVDLDNPYQP